MPNGNWSFSKLASIACIISFAIIYLGISSTSITGYPPLTMMVNQQPWVIPAIAISLIITLLLVILSVITREENTLYKVGPILYLLGVGIVLYWLFVSLRIQISL